jgi:anti-sigma factor RsiW
MSSPCRQVLPLLETFVDGELPPDKLLELEQHISDCNVCAARVRFEGSLRNSTRRAVRQAVAPSSALRDRIGAALSAERQRQAALSAERESKNGMLSWRSIVPIAAAAAFTLAWAATADDRHDETRVDEPDPADSPLPQSGISVLSNAAGTTVANLDQLIEQFVDYHAQAATPEITEPGLVEQLEPQVGVPVRLPSLQQYGARWEGGGVLPVRNRPVASLRYRLGGHRVTLYVYNSSRFPLRATLEPRVVRDEPVYVGTRRGYSIAAVERRGVGYAVASDLDDRESAELVASIH